MNEVLFTLSFSGETADHNQIDFYDVSHALVGFQRSLALTAHLVLNGEIITQAPSLKGAQVLTQPAEAGSWKITAAIIASAWAIGNAPKDSAFGNIIYSVYDYVISESLGFHVDYDKTLGELYQRHKANQPAIPKVEQHHVDSLMEKCTTAITEIHRPIVKTQTASTANITCTIKNRVEKIGPPLNVSTFAYIHEVFADEDPVVIVGRVSSYNSNTFKGRIYVAAEGRPIPFELSERSRSNDMVRLIVASLSQNAIQNRNDEWSVVYCLVQRNTSRSGHLKSFTVLRVSHTTT
jgi:hypothetical protein